MANERIGLFLLGVGGAMLFALLYNLISNAGVVYNSGILLFPAFTILSFLGFVVLGLGFWLLIYLRGLNAKFFATSSASLQQSKVTLRSTLK